MFLMLRKIPVVAATIVVTLLVSCNLPGGPPPITNVQVVNNLSNVTLTVAGRSLTLDAVDLYGVFVGNVSFQYIPGGASSPKQTDSDTGAVKVSVDSGVGYFNGNAVCVFTNITTPSSARITIGALNTVEFDFTSLTQAKFKYYTSVVVENNLTNLSLIGFPEIVDSIDLAGVSVGNTSFTSVPAGTTTLPQNLTTLGTAKVTVDSVFVHTTFNNQPTELRYAYTGSLTVAIAQGITDTVVFDSTTANLLVKALSKKRAQ